MLQTLVMLNEMVSEGAIGDYALCGAMAAFHYIEPAATFDMDVTVEMDGISASIVTFDKIKDFFIRKGIPIEWKMEGIEIAGVPVQFLPAVEALDKEALATALTLVESGVSFKVWRAEYLMAKCLQIGRPKDSLRLTQFLETNFEQAMLCKLIKKFELRDKWTSFCRKFDLEDFCGRS